MRSFLTKATTLTSYRLPKQLTKILVKRASKAKRTTHEAVKPEAGPSAAPKKAAKAAATTPKVYIIKKIARNTQALFIDTLDRLSLRLRSFIVAAPKPAGRRKKGQAIPGPAIYKTPEELVAALNDSCLRSGSQDIHYEVA